jgi:hypothetical protein
MSGDYIKFRGYEWVSHDFSELGPVVLGEVKAWKGALSMTKGVYLVIDKEFCELYVGATWGKRSLWSTLRCYFTEGHGWNDDAIKAINQKKADKSFLPENFKFSVLEVFPHDAPDELVCEREKFWKDMLRLKRAEDRPFVLSFDM